jgi:cysteinyl-tRNA synthetase
MANGQLENTTGNVDNNLSRHKPAYNANTINRALKRANEDQEFLDSALKLLDNEQMQFPAFKEDIVNYISIVSDDIDIISLFQSLDGYIKFKDVYQIRKAFEENNPAKKTQHQISDSTRINPDVRTRDITTNSSTKEKEAINLSEERKDYPEVTPTAMSQYICNLCGKPFQTRDDLVHHQEFEKGKA